MKEVHIHNIFAKDYHIRWAIRLQQRCNTLYIRYLYILEYINKILKRFAIVWKEISNMFSFISHSHCSSESLWQRGANYPYLKTLVCRSIYRSPKIVPRIERYVFVSLVQCRVATYRENVHTYRCVQNSWRKHMKGKRETERDLRGKCIFLKLDSEIKKLNNIKSRKRIQKIENVNIYLTSISLARCRN